MPTLEPRFKVIGCDLWSDDPGFAAATAATGVTGICGSGIIEILAELYLAGVIRHDGVINGELAARNPRIQSDGRTFSYEICKATVGTSSIKVTQNDVRAIQLGKAALYAGVRLLMERMGIDKVDRIRLAGAFGSHIDVKYAMVLGMIPDCALDHVSSAGNAAGTGARIALLDQRSRREIEQLVRRVEKIETAVEPRFQEFFVEAMAIPHLTAPFERLREVVTLPERTAINNESSGARAAGCAARSRGPRGLVESPFHFPGAAMKLKTLSLVATALLSLGLQAQAAAAEDASCKTVRFADVGWSDIAATTGWPRSCSRSWVTSRR
jgi:uncharacterized 2Fe-2S/4Fe-4S cluster protein (DUF4445 family)